MCMGVLPANTSVHHGHAMSVQAIRGQSIPLGLALPTVMSLLVGAEN